ncbi:hypothetical protein ESA94_02260 [Lacibacter luteus]|uniref:Cytochrome c domain-containing protein n=1 Tax=Lacibacter luteus TaxID=2508719 RepID=A0A4Q1CME2_9BACT|nr:hypothetical protein [Lacibacter luteus]RXK61861.1 hypothetical protein ESA94_02260 [Lacibacter luteus]
MKKALLLISLFVLFLLACTRENKPSFLNTGNIRTQIFTIDPAKANTLKGFRGGIFNIPAGAFEGTAAVTIELKEVYAPIEILAAGLTTESNGELLESGGMFYINAKRDGIQLELKKDIQGSIPADYINDSMKLFKGDLKEDGSLNWVEPEALLPATDSNTLCIQAGERIFKSNCLSCHDISKKITGPTLINSGKYYNSDEYYRLLKNPGLFAKENRRFDCQIYDYNGVIMTAFPAISKDNVSCMIKYFENEKMKRPDLATKLDKQDFDREGCDSITIEKNKFPCGIDTFYNNEEFEKIVANSFADIKTTDTIIKPFQSSGIDTLNTDFQAPNEYRYEFKINSLGWYNIDILLKKLEGITEVTLDATTTFKEKEQVDIRLLFPEKRIELKSEYHKESETYTFGMDDNTIPLFIGDIAIMFAIAEESDKIYYSVREFRITKEQHIEMPFKETSKEKLEEAFKKVNLDNIILDRQTKKPVIVRKNCSESGSFSDSTSSTSK